MEKSSLTEIVHKAIVGRPGGPSIEEIAADLDKAPSSLYCELNPFGEKGKLGLDDAHKAMLMVKNPALVRAMAADFGCRLDRADNTPDGLNMQDELMQGLEAVNHFMQAVNKKNHHTELLPLLEYAIKELEDVWSRARSDNAKVKQVA